MFKTEANKLIPVSAAHDIILAERRDYGTEYVSFASSSARVLAEDIVADRDIPPFNRVAMDGIAIRYSGFETGIRSFKVTGVQAAGGAPVDLTNEDQCIEIMTGAALPSTADTVIRYEDVEISNGIAYLQIDQVSKGQHIHFQGSDKMANEVVIPAGQVLSPAVVNVLASVGKSQVLVKKVPTVLIVSTGDELTDIDEIPSPLQIRRSNSYSIRSAIAVYGIAADVKHIPDTAAATEHEVGKALERYDVIILSGGISMGRFDFVERAMTACGVEKRFYKVQQKPGKPFWFGVHASGNVVFAFPGNPVSTFMCVYRYFIPWLQASLGLPEKKIYAALTEDVQFKPPLQYFLQVKLSFGETGQLHATPLAGNGSGDFANLTDSEAFVELPASVQHFRKGEAYRIWPYKPVL